MEERFENIIEALKEKACVKQKIYRSTREVFDKMKELGKALSGQLAERFEAIDKTVQIEYKDVNEFEFQIKFSGDLLIYTMHSNVITFPDEHMLINNPYVRQDRKRGFFGHIMVYNFMADSIKYNRLTDSGYLIARMLINNEQHFYIEGVRQLNFLHPDLSQNQLDDQMLRIFIESAMLTAIDNDLLAPNYHDIQEIQLGFKVANQMVHAGSKLGFRMGHTKESHTG